MVHSAILQPLTPHTCTPHLHTRHTMVSHSEFPGQLQKILEWFRDYKIPDGKPANAFGYDNKCLDKKFTLQVRAEGFEGAGRWIWLRACIERDSVCGK